MAAKPIDQVAVQLDVPAAMRDGTARLPGADGRVAMYGASYMGITQWQAAVMQPPSLTGLAPGITWGNYLNGTFFRGGARELGTAHYWTQAAIAPNVVARRYGADVRQLMERLREVVAVIDDLPHGYDVLPLSELPDPAGAARAHREWLAASLDDPLWRRLNIEGRYDRVRAPTLHIGGWYDIFLGETLRQY